MQTRKPFGQIGHVERTGDHVQLPDTDQQQRGADSAEHEVIETRLQRLALGPHGDQDVGRQRRHFEQHVKVECVARDHDAEQAGDAQQIHAVEKMHTVGGDFLGDA